MSKFILILIIPLFIFIDSDKISWSSSRNLKWSDFKGNVPAKKGLEVAISTLQIEIVGDFYEDEIPDVKVIAYFLPNNSWTIVNDDETLSHEQLHFDIAELYACNIRKKYDSLKEKKITNFNVYSNIYHNELKLYRARQKKYDSEAYFNDETQNKWCLNIAKELEELKEYQYKE
jgi:hypothetical protein